MTLKKRYNLFNLARYFFSICHTINWHPQNFPFIGVDCNIYECHTRSRLPREVIHTKRDTNARQRYLIDSQSYLSESKDNVEVVVHNRHEVFAEVDIKLNVVSALVQTGHRSG